MRVCVAIALAGRQEVIELDLEPGSTVGEALARAMLNERFPGLGIAAVGIWSQPCGPETVLREGDRVEVYRALEADAKDQRRARARLKPASPRSRNAP